MNTNVLLPCPFCGTAPHLAVPGDSYYRYQITCPTCQFRSELYEEGQQDVLFAKWNRRPSSLAPLNTQGGALREALEAVSKGSFYGSSTGYFHVTPAAYAKVGAALAQSEQEHSILSPLDVAEALQKESGGLGVGIWQKTTLPAQPGTSSVRFHNPQTMFIAYADNGTSTPVTAGGDTLESVMGQMIEQLNNRNQ